jgi:hypothetical protein
MNGHQDAIGATADRARRTLPSSFAGASRLPQAWREDTAVGRMINPPFKVRNEPESIKTVDPPLVLTEVLHPPGISRNIR